MDLLGLLLPSGRALSAQHRRDATVAIVGFTSWSAVAWKLSRSAESPEEAAQASLAAVSAAWRRPGACDALACTVVRCGLHSLPVPARRAGQLAANGSSISRPPHRRPCRAPFRPLPPQAATLLCLWPLALGLLSSESYAWWREWLIPTHLAAQHWIGLHFSLLPGTQHQAMVGGASWGAGLGLLAAGTDCAPRPSAAVVATTRPRRTCVPLPASDASRCLARPPACRPPPAGRAAGPPSS